MKKLKYIKLFESFTINKNEIIDIIDSIKKDPDVKTNMSISPTWKWDYIYSFLRKNDIIGYGEKDTEEIKKKWKHLSSIKTLSVFTKWVGNMEKYPGDDKVNGETYNRYFSIDSTSLENVNSYINNLYKLHNSLKALSKELEKTILWKTHDSFDGFIKDHDSLKIYWYDNDEKLDLNGKIKKLVENWLIDNNIKTIKRKHNRGVDLNKWEENTGRGAGPSGTGFSYGQILSYLIYHRLYHFIVANIKYPSDIIFKSFSDKLNIDDDKSLISLIQNEWRNKIITTEKFKKYIEGMPNSLMDRDFFKR